MVWKLPPLRFALLLSLITLRGKSSLIGVTVLFFKKIMYSKMKSEKREVGHMLEEPPHAYPGI